MAWLSPQDLQHWRAGAAFDSYRKLGAHPNRQGTWFCVWAPHATAVHVVGDFNQWNGQAHPLQPSEAGLWSGYVRGARPGHHYKYRVQRGGYLADKTDPYGFALEAPHPDGNPITGLSAIITDLAYDWHDADWMTNRQGPEGLKTPVSVYEVHLGSWRRKPDGASLSYREIAEPLADYALEMGFTHVEFLPLLEHPYYPSWGYQVVGYFAPTHRYGSPTDLKYLIDYLHQRGLGVIMDWVPAHFATDPQGLVFFDGTPQFEYGDPRMRFHPDWGTYIFDYAKPGVRNFLISNALFWLDEYHIDGLRFDAVASMLYRDYSRQEWTPNIHGGRENLEAISLLKNVNEEAYARFPDVMMIAEESTAWPKVSAPTFEGGLGFLYKWNMGWMHDTLEYMQMDPFFRQHHQRNVTFPLMYAFSEHFMLPLSHDEVVHMKGSLWGKMPGDDWQKAASLRLLFAHMIGHPGKKLLFMGGEFGQTSEWGHDRALDWHLLDEPFHQGLQHWWRDVNTLYRSHEALWDDTPTGFRWVDFSDHQQSVISYLRTNGEQTLLFILNFTPIPRGDYPVGVPTAGIWQEKLNSDSQGYGGSGVGNAGAVASTPTPWHGYDHAITVTLPPLGALVFELAEARPEGPEGEQ